MKPETKYCKFCDNYLPISNFRIRIEKRLSKCKNGQPFEYFNNKCLSCEKEYNENYHQRLRKTGESKNRNKAYYQRLKKRNPNRGKELWQERKNSEKWKEHLKNWRENNKERVAALHKVRVTEWHRREIDSISDSYCVTRILFKNEDPNITREYILQNPELIDIKRTQILLHRLKLKILKDGEENII